MPAVLKAIDKMSVSEKVNTVEYIWNALAAHYTESTPTWHADILAARRRKIESGEAEFLSIEESESLLERECHAR